MFSNPEFVIHLIEEETRREVQTYSDELHLTRERGLAYALFKALCNNELTSGMRFYDFIVKYFRDFLDILYSVNKLLSSVATTQSGLDDYVILSIYGRHDDDCTHSLPPYSFQRLLLKHT